MQDQSRLIDQDPEFQRHSEMSEEQKDLLGQAPEKKKRAPLTNAQRARIASMYESGETLDKIAKQFNRSIPAIHVMLRRMGLSKRTDQKKAVAAQAASQAAKARSQAVAMDAAIVAQRAYDTKNESYRLQELIRKLVGKLIVETKQANRPLATIHGDLRALKEAAATLKISREEAFIVLGIAAEGEAEEDELPDLKVHDLTDDQIDSLRGATQIDELFAGEGDDFDIPEVGVGSGEEEPGFGEEDEE